MVIFFKIFIPFTVITTVKNETLAQFVKYFCQTIALSLHTPTATGNSPKIMLFIFALYQLMHSSMCYFAFEQKNILNEIKSYIILYNNN